MTTWVVRLCRKFVPITDVDCKAATIFLIQSTVKTCTASPASVVAMAMADEDTMISNLKGEALHTTKTVSMFRTNWSNIDAKAQDGSKTRRA
jgi:hypothetical protein